MSSNDPDAHGRWLGDSDLRVGLGCMRLSTDPDREAYAAVEVIAAAAAAGITIFDTAHAYGLDDAEAGHNERLLGDALRRCGLDDASRIVTKGGMRRVGSAWVPDGRTRTILADCEASLEALDGLGIDLYLVHAPDPSTSWSTTMRALRRLLDEGMVRHVGLSNVTRTRIDEARDVVPVSAVQNSLSVYDTRALRSGLVDHCAVKGIAFIAHSPLGGPHRAARLHRHETLVRIAAEHRATTAEVALSWLLDLGPHIVVIPGARRPESVRSAVRAAELRLQPSDREVLGHAFGRPRPERIQSSMRRDDSDVVLIMGIPGSGKSRLAEEYVARGYRRLNRDERGGTLRGISAALEEALASGERRVVLDNTWLDRASRADAVDVAARHGVGARCVWLDTPLAQAQVNIVMRLLERLGSLPEPEDLRRIARSDPAVMSPTSQMRTLRELEQPSTDEGFAIVERVPFVRDRHTGNGVRIVFVAAAALRADGWRRVVRAADPGTPHVVFDWRPGAPATALDADAASLAEAIDGAVDTALCAHPGGPPVCWCRPPLPGLALAFARAGNVDPSMSLILGVSAAHRTLASTLGARFVSV